MHIWTKVSGSGACMAFPLAEEFTEQCREKTLKSSEKFVICIIVAYETLWQERTMGGKKCGITKESLCFDITDCYIQTLYMKNELQIDLYTRLQWLYHISAPFVILRGYCTSYPKLTCFMLYLKIINTFLKNNLCILY